MRFRFRNLERARPARELPQAGGAGEARRRFEAIQAPGEPMAAATPAAPLELDLRGPEDQPFLRCLRCGSDNNARATTCANCDAPFSDPEQRDFNERLWARLKQEAELERKSAAAAPGVRPAPESSEVNRPPESIAVNRPSDVRFGARRLFRRDPTRYGALAAAPILIVALYRAYGWRAVFAIVVLTLAFVLTPRR